MLCMQCFYEQRKTEEIEGPSLVLPPCCADSTCVTELVKTFFGSVEEMPQDMLTLFIHLQLALGQHGRATRAIVDTLDRCVALSLSLLFSHTLDGCLSVCLVSHTQTHNHTQGHTGEVECSLVFGASHCVASHAECACAETKNWQHPAHWIRFT